MPAATLTLTLTLTIALTLTKKACGYPPRRLFCALNRFCFDSDEGSRYCLVVSVDASQNEVDSEVGDDDRKEGYEAIDVESSGATVVLVIDEWK